MHLRSMPSRWRLVSLAAVLMLVACGTDQTASPDEPATQPETSVAPAPDDVRDVEVLSVSDGSTTTLREAVVGDRPVLLWFWAPH